VTDAGEYEGAGVVRLGDEAHAVRVSIAGRFEPVDGRYHWQGRIAPDPAIERLARGRDRDVVLELATGVPRPARLAEVDPWGGVRVEGIGRPPWL
jgi:hypothetical protein